MIFSLRRAIHQDFYQHILTYILNYLFSQTYLISYCFRILTDSVIAKLLRVISLSTNHTHMYRPDILPVS